MMEWGYIYLAILYYYIIILLYRCALPKISLDWLYLLFSHCTNLLYLWFLILLQYLQRIWCGCEPFSGNTKGAIGIEGTSGGEHEITIPHKTDSAIPLLIWNINNKNNIIWRWNILYVRTRREYRFDKD